MPFAAILAYLLKLAHDSNASAQDSLGRLGIHEVRVGLTSYGITNRVRKILAGQEASDQLNAPTSYTDAARQWILAKIS